MLVDFDDVSIALRWISGLLGPEKKTLKGSRQSREGRGRDVLGFRSNLRRAREKDALYRGKARDWVWVGGSITMEPPS